jgi:ABC-type multidrug transport system fused ATPase/permease subunit
MELKDDMKLVEESAEKGGASEFIGKLKLGYETVLDPMNDPYAYNQWKQPDHAVFERMRALDRKTDISGGERQRLAA